MLKRLANSTVVWSWILNGLRAGSGLIIFSLLWHKLSTSEFGMSGVLLQLASMALIFDFGFGPTIDRFVAYAMAGTEKLEAIGLSQPAERKEPNYLLLWELLVTTRKLYRYLTVALFFTFGIGGTLLIENLVRRETAIHPDFSGSMSRLAWAVTLVATMLDIYSNWWAIYLRGMNQIRTAVKLTVLAMTVRLVLATALLLWGAGLLSVPLAGIVSSFIQRHFTRVKCLQLLPPAPPIGRMDLRKSFAVLWPNSWRHGVQLASSFLIIQLNTFVCAHVFHLGISGQYTASVQLMGYASSMAAVWTMVKWPLIGQYQVSRDYASIQHLLWSRVWLQIFTFAVLAGGVIFVMPGFLHWIGKDKELLPLPWLLALAVNNFLEMLLATSGTLIATGNRLPFIWHSVLSNLLSLLLSLSLLRFTQLGPGALVAGPMLAGCIFNYWYWPAYAARSIQTTLFRFLFFGPAKKKLGSLGV